MSGDRKQFITDAASADYPFDASVYPVDLNKDGIEEVFIVWGNTFTSGNTGSSVHLFVRDGTGDYTSNLGFPGCCLKILATPHLGFPDLLIGGPGMEMPVWRWNGKQYDYYKTIKDDEAATIKGTDLETANR